MSFGTRFSARRTGGAAVVSFCLSSWSLDCVAADAFERSTARQSAELGEQEYERGDFEAAAKHLDLAYGVFPSPQLGLLSGRALFEAGRWVEASERFYDVTQLEVKDTSDDEDAEREAIEAAARERAELLPRIPQLKVEIAGATGGQVTVRVGERELGATSLGVFFPMDPGSVEVVAEGEGTRASQQVQLRAGLELSVLLQLAPTAPPDPAQAFPDETATEQSPARDDKSGVLLLLSGGVKAGLWGHSFGDTDIPSTTGALLQLGGAATVGYTFRSGFAMGVQTRGGGIKDLESDFPFVGYLGGALDMGAVFAGGGSTMGYILAGPGIEGQPNGGPPWFLAQFHGGASLGGFLIGGGLDVAITQQQALSYSPSTGITTSSIRATSYRIVFGLEVGFGKTL